MPELIHIPKFKTGETLDTKNELSSQFIVVSTYNKIFKYSSHYRYCDSYKDDSPQTTLYYCFGIYDRCFTWYFEYDFLPTVYCSNTNRGKEILRKHEVSMFKEARIINADLKKEFLKEFFGDEPKIINMVPINMTNL